MSARSHLPSTVLLPGESFLPIQPDFVPTPYEIAELVEQSPRAVVSWPARTWSPAERVTAGMLNGWRDQLNDLRAAQQTLLAKMPTVGAKKFGDTVNTAAEVIDFVQMPSNMGAFDTLVVDVEYTMHT